MKKGLLALAGLLVVVIVVLFLIPREDPVDYLYREFPQTQGWGNLKVVTVTESDEVVALEVTFDVDKTFQAHEKWIIKDRSKLQEVPGGQFEKWHGYVYLVKDGLFTWEAVE
ncbi:hypothetical protein CBW65_23610 [Tumebacillus avium]|uniref:Uncharacterized protein n=1 Tax=Tumebacillus avium TaxID=1903704 RepID=A0A1Y0ISQ8_9BACL|nr:hypothetical protein [Tumebacillus avium]ARU63672.1 hypothetical protein CBW65_23610 [Tumebacillus avium]